MKDMVGLSQLFAVGFYKALYYIIVYVSWRRPRTKCIYRYLRQLLATSQYPNMHSLEAPLKYV